MPNPASSPDDPSLWLAKVRAFSPMAAPCFGFRPGEWPAALEAARAFLENHADLAYGLGWRAVDLFGVHRTVGATRVDCCGALMVSAGALVERVERNVIHFARGRYFRVSPSPEAVLMWEFGKG